MNGKEYTVISTFCGTGGSSLGYKLAGFKELLAIDFESHAIECFKANFPEVTCWQRDIKTVTTQEILKQCNLKVGELDVFDGSPPCQGFSTAGKRQLTDPRNNLFIPFVELIKGLQPKVFVMENVSGMIKGGYKGKFNEILQVLSLIGYNVKVKLMNAKYYNVAQSRQRLLFIGVRKDLDIQPTFPIPSNKVISVKNCVKDIDKKNDIKKEIVNKFINDNYDKVKVGRSFSSKHEKGSYFNTVKCYWLQPSQTITKTPNILHPFEKRYLSINEVKALCSFPQNWILGNNFNDAWNRLGNAVMPNMMKAIAENIKINILDKIVV